MKGIADFSISLTPDMDPTGEVITVTNAIVPSLEGERFIVLRLGDLSVTFAGFGQESAAQARSVAAAAIKAADEIEALIAARNGKELS